MQCNHLIPLLDVQNVDESIRFYRDALGFSVEDQLTWNGRTDWALLKSGKVEIMLSESQSEAGAAPAAKAAIFFFYLDEPETLYRSLQANGYELSSIQQGQRGAKEFCIQDPDGHVLWFSPRRVGLKAQAVG